MLKQNALCNKLGPSQNPSNVVNRLHCLLFNLKTTSTPPPRKKLRKIIKNHKKSKKIQIIQFKK
jgi:hypothetical protein